MTCVRCFVPWQVLLVPAKFAMTFTLGSGLFQTAFAMLRGPAKHLRGLFAKDRLGGTLVYLFSCGESSARRRKHILRRDHDIHFLVVVSCGAGFTLYAAIIARSYVLVITAVCLQVGPGFVVGCCARMWRAVLTSSVHGGTAATRLDPWCGRLSPTFHEDKRHSKVRAVRWFFCLRVTGFDRLVAIAVVVIQCSPSCSCESCGCSAIRARNSSRVASLRS